MPCRNFTRFSWKEHPCNSREFCCRLVGLQDVDNRKEKEEVDKQMRSSPCSVYHLSVPTMSSCFTVVFCSCVQDLDSRKQKEEADKLTRQMQQASMHLGSGSPNAYPAPPGSSSGEKLRGH